MWAARQQFDKHFTPVNYSRNESKHCMDEASAAYFATAVSYKCKLFMKPTAGRTLALKETRRSVHNYLFY